MRVVLWILEDDHDLGFLVKTVCSFAKPGIELRWFATGAAAVMAKGAPDIVFADADLAGEWTAPEVVDVLRRRHPAVAVLFSSSLGLPPEVILGPRDRSLSKPFSMSAMLRQVLIMISQIPRLQVPPSRPPLPPPGLAHH